MKKTLALLLALMLVMSAADFAFALPSGTRVETAPLTEAEIKEGIAKVLIESVRYDESIFVNNFKSFSRGGVNYTAGYFANTAEPSSWTGNGDGGAGEAGTRPNADILFTYAFLLKYFPDAVYPNGITAETMKNHALQSLRYAYGTHVSNKYITAKYSNNLGTYYWGSGNGTVHWESSMWAESVAYAAYLLWDELDQNDKDAIKNMVVAEADQQLTRSVPTGYISDTKAEENGWDTNILAVAVAMYPDHANAARWDEKCKEFGMNSYSTQSDAYDTTIVDGKEVRRWYRGAPTLFNDYTLENHDFFHTSYLTVVNQELAESCLSYQMLMSDEYKSVYPVPDALKHNVREVWDNILKQLATSDSELAMPNGNDWSMYLLDQMESYASLATIFQDSDAMMLEGRCIQLIAARQKTTGNGSFLLNPDCGARRMGVSARRLAFAYLLHEYFPAQYSSVPAWDEFSAANEKTSYLPYARILRANSSDRFVTFSWYQAQNGSSWKSFMGNFVPNASENFDQVFTVFPYRNGVNTGNFTGNFVTTSGSGASVTAINNRLYDDSFVTLGQMNVNGGAMTQYSAFYATPGNAIIYLDEVKTKSAVTVTEELGMPLGITTDTFTHTDRTLYYDGGKITSNGASRSVFDSRWVNIDDSVGLIVAGSRGMMFGDRALDHSVYVSKIYGSYSNRTRQYAANTVIASRAMIAYSNVDHETTGALLTELKTPAVEAGWKAVAASDPNGRRYLVAANLYGNGSTAITLSYPEGAPVLRSETTIKRNKASATLSDSAGNAEGMEMGIYLTTNGDEITAVRDEYNARKAYIINNNDHAIDVTVRAYSEMNEDGTECPGGRFAEDTITVEAGEQISVEEYYGWIIPTPELYLGGYGNAAYGKNPYNSTDNTTSAQPLNYVSGSLPIKALDNDLSSAWISLNTGTDAFAASGFYVDLGCAHTVDSVRIYSLENYRPKDVTISAGNSLSNLKTVATATLANISAAQAISFNAVTARYVRLDVSSVYGGAVSAGVSEFQVYGSRVTPEVTPLVNPPIYDVVTDAPVIEKGSVGQSGKVSYHEDFEGEADVLTVYNDGNASIYKTEYVTEDENTFIRTTVRANNAKYAPYIMARSLVDEPFGGTSEISFKYRTSGENDTASPPSVGIANVDIDFAPSQIPQSGGRQLFATTVEAGRSVIAPYYATGSGYETGALKGESASTVFGVDFAEDEWHDVKIQLDIQGGKWYLDLDGEAVNYGSDVEEKYSDLALSDAFDKNGAFAIYFFAGRSDKGAVIDVDDIKICRVENYAGGLFAKSASLVYSDGQGTGAAANRILDGEGEYYAKVEFMNTSGEDKDIRIILASYKGGALTDTVSTNAVIASHEVLTVETDALGADEDTEFRIFVWENGKMIPLIYNATVDTIGVKY